MTAYFMEWAETADTLWTLRPASLKCSYDPEC